MNKSSFNTIFYKSGGFLIIFLCFLNNYNVVGQDSLLQEEEIERLESKYLKAIENKANYVNNQLSKQTLKFLKRFRRKEAKLMKLLSRVDSTSTSKVFNTGEDYISNLEHSYTNGIHKSTDKITGEYNSYLDTLQISLKFLNENQTSGSLLRNNSKLTEINGNVNALAQKFKNAEEIKKQLKLRKDILKQQLEKYGLGKKLKKLSKETYYYGQYIKEYKEVLRDPKKIERKTLSTLNKIPSYQKFMSKNSVLASIWNHSTENQFSAVGAALPGLQTRQNVQQIMKDKVGAVSSNAVRVVEQQFKNAQGQLNKIKDRINQFGSSEIDMPDFKPNNQKTKSFSKRIEYGISMQFGKQNNFLPVSTDVAVSIGYKINSNGIVGIGASYRMGLGSGWNKIKLTHEGIGLRSYIDWKLKARLYLSGGYEQNHIAGFKNINQLKNFSKWQSAGLIGLSKKIQMKGKFNSKVQILYDLLSNRHNPRSQAFIYRVCYNLK